MKKFFALIFSVIILFSITACSSGNNTKPSKKKNAEVISAKTKKNMDKTLKLNRFEGIVQLTKNGKPVYSSVSGTDEKGNKLSVNSTMYIGSVSKQFCAAAILKLRDEGKLSVDDTLNKYFPEFSLGKKITLKNLLTMRSGLRPDFDSDSVGASPEKSEVENTAAYKKTIFKSELIFEPGTKYTYANTNYFLLASIVEEVSEKSYISYIRDNFFTPLGMTNSGFVDEVRDNPKWAKGLTYDTFTDTEKCKGLTKGAGDVASNAEDMDKWMTALKNGKVVSKKSFREMTKDYSPDSGERYGYALMLGPYGGVGHAGLIGSYYARDYINEKHGYNLFIASGKAKSQYEYLTSALMKDLVK